MASLDYDTLNYSTGSQSAQGYETKLLELVYGEERIRLEIDMKFGIGGDTWPAADQFCSLIASEDLHTFFTGLFQDKSVIELGAGTGIAGIVVDRLFEPTKVAITDHISHVPLIDRNISLNQTKTCFAMEYDWCNRPSAAGKFDIVLAFECVYREELFLPLIQSLDELCHEGSVVLFGLTRLFAKPKFFQLLKKRHFRYTMVPKSNFEKKYSEEHEGRDIALFVLHKLPSHSHHPHSHHSSTQ